MNTPLDPRYRLHIPHDLVEKGSDEGGSGEEDKDRNRIYVAVCPICKRVVGAREKGRELVCCREKVKVGHGKRHQTNQRSESSAPPSPNKGSAHPGAPTI